MLVDFSSKKDIYIHHKDGSFTPMDQPYYEVTAINDTTWQIMSSGDYHYLLAGEEEAIAIDTGYGAGNLRTFLEELCGKPVPRVINTHHHFDHCANNCYFEEAYMGEDALDQVSIPYASFAGMNFFPGAYRKTVVRDGDCIGPKGRELKVFCIGDHTSDGIALLDQKERILFAGDEFMAGHKRFDGPVGAWRQKIEKLREQRGEFDLICSGSGLLPAEEFDKLYRALQQLEAGLNS